MVFHYFYKNLGKEAKIVNMPVIVHAILIEGGFLHKGQTWADLKYQGNEPSESDKLIIDIIGIIKMPIQSFTSLVGIGSKSEDLH